MPQFIAQQFELLNETVEMLGKSRGKNANHCVKEVAFVMAKTDIQLNRLAPS